MQLDDHDLPIATTSPVAAGAYREGVRLLLSAWPGADGALDRAVADDPQFALAHAARARLHAIRGEGSAARTSIARAAELVAAASDREKSHIEVLAAAITGSPRALELALRHADAWPTDVLILGLPLGAFGLLAFSGMRDHDQSRVDLVERHAAAFGADDWWFLTYRGWAHAENGEVARGRDMLERSFELFRENANGVHALTHALHEDGAGDDADVLIGSWLPTYDRAGILHGHIAWHSALVALERDDPDDALRIYDEHIRPAVSLGLPINIVSDAASLLWRLAAQGHDVPEGLWRDAAEYASRRYPKAGHAFIDAHMAVIEAMTGDRQALRRRLAGLEELVNSGSIGAGPVVPAIGRAALAFADGDYAEVVRLIEPLAPDVARIGGSGAQREMFEEMLLLSWIRGGEMEKARELLDSRLHRRPSPRDSRWREGLAV